MTTSRQADGFLRYGSSMHTTPLAVVIGGNVRRIRTKAGITTEQLAQYAVHFGLKWSDSRVSAMERGKVSPTLPTLLALCMALSAATQKEVGLPDLAQGDSEVKITDRVTLSAQALVDALSGTPADLRATEDERFEQALRSMAVRQAGGEAEQRAAQSLGITGRRFKELAAELWGRPFAEERDARAGTDANAQKRGRVARQLKAEMQAALEDRVRGNGQ